MSKFVKVGSKIYKIEKWEEYDLSKLQSLKSDLQSKLVGLKKKKTIPDQETLTFWLEFHTDEIRRTNWTSFLAEVNSAISLLGG